MPDLGITEILAIASLIAGGVETGVQIHSANESRDAQQAALKQQQQQQAQQALLQKREALGAASANSQAQTGGSLTGIGGQSFADILAGYAGSTGSGSSNAPSGAVSSPQYPGEAPNPVQQLIASLGQPQGQQSPFSGGWQPPPPNTSGTRFNLSGMQLG